MHGWVYVSCLKIFVLKTLDVIYLQPSQINVVVEAPQWYLYYVIVMSEPTFRIYSQTSLMRHCIKLSPCIKWSYNIRLY